MSTLLVIVVFFLLGASLLLALTVLNGRRIMAKPYTVDELDADLSKELGKWRSLIASGKTAGVQMRLDLPSLNVTRSIAMPQGDERPFHVASISKLFTTALAFRLAERGTIDLNQTIERYISDEAHQRFLGKLYTNAPTLLQLLQHRGGLADYFEDKSVSGKKLSRDWWPSIPIGFHDFLEVTMEHFRPIAAPGEKFHYSDSGFALLIYTLEQASGLTRDKLYNEEVFKPLGLSESYLAAFPPVDGPVISPMFLSGEDLSRDPYLSVGDSDGGIISTLKDLSSFIGGLFSETFLSQGSLQTMMDIHSSFRYGIGYGAGMMELQLHRFAPGVKDLPRWFGHMGITGTQLYFEPESKSIIVINMGSTAFTVASAQLAVKMAMKLARLRERS